MTPEGWKATELVDLLAEPIRNGYSPVCPSAPNGRWVLSLSAVTFNGFNPRGVKPAPINDMRVDDFLLENGDVVVSRSNTRERVSLAGIYKGMPPHCAYPDLLMRIRCSTLLSSDFLVHNLLSSKGRYYFQQRARGTSGSMVKIDRAILEAFPVLLPPLPEQRKIAAILSSVDEAIEGTQAVIDQLQVVKKAMMAELLTRGIPGRHTKFKTTEIGEIPEEWEVVRLEQLAERICVGIVVKPASYYTDTGVPCLRGKNVKVDRLVLDDVVYISPESNVLLGKSILRTGDVVTVRTGEPGTSCVVPASLDGTNCIDIIITTPGPRVDGKFLSRFLNSAGGRGVVAMGKGGLPNNISMLEQ